MQWPPKPASSNRRQRCVGWLIVGTARAGKFYRRKDAARLVSPAFLAPDHQHKASALREQRRPHASRRPKRRRLCLHLRCLASSCPDALLYCSLLTFYIVLSRRGWLVRIPVCGGNMRKTQRRVDDKSTLHIWKHERVDDFWRLKASARLATLLLGFRRLRLAPAAPAVFLFFVLVEVVEVFDLVRRGALFLGALVEGIV